MNLEPQHPHPPPADLPPAAALLALLLTPPGSGAIAVVRLIGPKTSDFLATHFSGCPVPGRCVHGDLRDGVDVIDDPVVVIASDGRSADVNLHGGPWVVRSMLDMARRAGFTIIEKTNLPLPPGAVDGASEIEREIQRHLPMATTEIALSELLRQQESWERFESLAEADRRADSAAMLNDRGLWWLLNPPRAAIVGAANVGKSTLANRLFGQERSITADLPGTTRDWVGESTNLDGMPVILIDTPGIRATRDEIEAAAILRAADAVRAADLVVLVLDASHPYEGEQASLHARFPAALVVVNKCDLSAAWDWRSISSCQTVATSGNGIDALQEKIKDVFGVHARRDGARYWTDRQKPLLSEV